MHFSPRGRAGLATGARERANASVTHRLRGGEGTRVGYGASRLTRPTALADAVRGSTLSVANVGTRGCRRISEEENQVTPETQRRTLMEWAVELRLVVVEKDVIARRAAAPACNGAR